MLNGSTLSLHPGLGLIFTLLGDHKGHPLREFLGQNSMGNAFAVFDRVMQHSGADHFLIVGHCRHDIPNFYRVHNVWPLGSLPELSFVCLGCKFNCFVNHNVPLLSLLIQRGFDFLYTFTKSCLFFFMKQIKDTRDNY